MPKFQQSATHGGEKMLISLAPPSGESCSRLPALCTLLTHEVVLNFIIDINRDAEMREGDLIR